MTRLPLALLLLSPLMVPAQAQDRPVIFPTRDVTVTYRASADGQPAEMTMSWLSAQRLMRMDLPGGQGYMIVNHTNGQGFMVMEPMRMIMDMPANSNNLARFTQASESARFTREGTDRVANTPCTVWRVEDRGDTGRVCSTGDGVMLRVVSTSGQNSGSLEAIRVVYAAHDASRFTRPQGYQTMQMPGGAGGLPGAGLPGAGFPGRGTALPPPGVAR